MNTRFSPSLNGSLHIGHLWMAWFNYQLAKQSGGLFILRYDDVAPRVAGEPPDKQPLWARQGQELLQLAGIVPDAITYVSSYLEGATPRSIGGNNLWLRAPALEGWLNVGCSPEMVAARVRADREEAIDIVVRGEELAPELQLYEYLNAQQGGPLPRLVFLPRLRVRVDGVLTTISKTYGNLQLRDLYAQAPPDLWVRRVRQACLCDPNLEPSLVNVHTDPVLNLDDM